MRVNMRPNIQVKEEKFCFTCPDCEIMYWDSDGMDLLKPYPKRCPDCNQEYCTWRRIKKWKRLLIDNFSYKRHKFIKFLTFSLEGEKTVYDLKDYRTELRTRFNQVRRTKFWNDHVDGGMWFFEVTMRTEHYQDTIDGGCFTNEHHIILNPHFHCLILGPKKIPIRNDYQGSGEVLEDVFKRFGIGEQFNIKGDPKRRGINAATGYITAYLKKEGQALGRNRAVFGLLRK